MKGFNLSGIFLALATALIGLAAVPSVHGQEPLANAQIEKKLVLYHSPNVPDTERLLGRMCKAYAQATALIC